jgi:CDP-glycerol glycerophosphotransferase
VILVDDGTTDLSAMIAQRYARTDARIRLVRQANAGLGAARNAGLRVARGEYLTFLDADDVLPLDAYSVMMSTIERTRSDLVVGTLLRDDGRRQSAMRLMRQNHRVRRKDTTLHEMPLILADVFAVNKIFRRSFWDQTGLKFWRACSTRTSPP